MRNKKGNLLAAVLFSLLALGCLQFVSWISEMAFENTGIELQEQYIGTEVRDIVDTIENSVNFGKELENYYGMEELLDQVREISPGNLEAALLDRDGRALYLSFGESEENVELLSQIYAEKYQSDIAKVTERGLMGEAVSLEDRESLVFPIDKDKTELMGHFLVLYRPKALLGEEDSSSLKRVKWMVWGVVSIGLFVFFSIQKNGEEKKGKRRYVPVALVLCGMLFHILLLFRDYQEMYSVMIRRNAESAAVSIQHSVGDLLEKGLPVERINELSRELNKKVESNVAIERISIVKSFYSTKDAVSRGDASVLNLEVADGLAQLDVVVSQSYITEKVVIMSLTFGAVFVVCMMITFELTHLAPLIAIRRSREFNRETAEQLGAVGRQVKLLSFLSYTAIYTSMSYTAVIMRGMDSVLFGCSPSVSASLPLTLELLCIMLCSVLAQKLLKDMGLERLLMLAFSVLILGNAACIVADSPYALLGLRPFCGIGFGLLKYGLNGIVAAGSGDPEMLEGHYARMNAGLLGGITAGASLGSILAQSLGYRFNYFFTGILCLCTIVFALAVLPWRMLGARRNVAEEAGRPGARLLDAFRNPSSLRVILLGDIPLNMGLMYVVAFLPMYLDQIGHPTIVTSYAYLVNGLAGVYLGAVLVRMGKEISGKGASVLALLLGASGILVLVLGSDIGIILLSAGIMGLFDGFGTPAVTGYFVGLPSVREADTAGMLTVFNSVGSAVQILCPMLYGVLIQPGGSTSYLMVFGVCYLAVAVLFLIFVPGGKLAK